MKWKNKSILKVLNFFEIYLTLIIIDPHIQPKKLRTKTEENQGTKNESDQVAIRKGN